MFGEVRANLNDQSIYLVQFSTLICRELKRNNTGVLHRVIAIVLQSLLLEQLFSHPYKLISLELCLVRYEAISMTNIFIRCSFSGLIVRGEKKGGCNASGHSNTFYKSIYCVSPFTSNYSINYNLSIAFGHHLAALYIGAI